MIRAEKGSGTFFPNAADGGSRNRYLAPFVLSFGLIVVGAAVLRLVDLDNRPMHCDEAVNAVRFGQLLEQNHYVYDPHEFHGPSLEYLTVPIAWLLSADKLTEISETHLRLLPAVFGILLVGLLWPLRNELGHLATFCAAVLTALSPAMVFYSRYYIHEMLLVCCTFGAIVALWCFARPAETAADDELRTAGRSWPRRALWLVLLAFCIGMMHASKETCVIPLFAMAVALVLTKKVPGTGLRGRRFLIPSLVVLVVALGAAAVSALLFSSLLNNPQGVLDSYATYGHYLQRISGQGSAGQHVYPWYHYLHLLFGWQSGDGPLWTEASIGLLALVGVSVGLLGGLLGGRLGGLLGNAVRQTSLPLVRFLSIYTLVMLVVYSAMPYKTPWCALGFLHGMILTAGVGAAVLIRLAPGYVLKTVVIAVLVAAAGHLGWQAWRAALVAHTDPNNPYVYAHTTDDVVPLTNAVQRVAAIYAEVEGSDPDAMLIQVICPDHDYWPLPWYLRRFRRVWCSDKVPKADDPATPPAAPLIITKPNTEDAMIAYAYRKHVPGQPILRHSLRKPDGTDWQLRPNVPLRVNVRHDLWERYSADHDKSVVPRKRSFRRP